MVHDPPSGGMRQANLLLDLNAYLPKNGYVIGINKRFLLKEVQCLKVVVNS